MALAYLAFAWVLGVAAAALTGGSAAAAVAGIGLLGAVSFARRPRASTLLFIALGAVAVLMAGWRYDATAPPRAPLGIARSNDSEVRFRATVRGEPDTRASSRLYRLDVTHVFLGDGWRRESGGVEMRAPLNPEYSPGDLLEIKGKLETPDSSEDFDYREHLLRRGVVSTIEYPRTRLVRLGDLGSLASLLGDIRSRLSDSLSDALPEPQASLAAGILLGNLSSLPRDLRDDMNATGTAHLVAVSGQNVMLVAGLLIAALTALVGRRRAAWLSLAGVIAYAALVGLQPSVLRATIMGSLYIISIAIGRQNTAGITLLLTAAGITAVSPQTVHDVSFQLSFAAALGLVLLAPLLRDRLAEALPPSVAHMPFARAGVELAAVTAAAIAFTLPITAVTFHRVSLVAPLANLFAVPAFVAVAATAGVAAVASLVPGLSALAAWLAWLPAAYMVAVMRFFADAPFASIELRDVSVAHAVGYYALLWAAIWWMSRRLAVRSDPPPKPPRLSQRPLVPAWGLAAVLTLSAALLWLAVTAPDTGRLTVTFLDVGQGDAVLIEGPQGHRILVDGGPSGEAISAALGRRVPFFDRRIDLVALTHPDADHLAGLPAVVDRYEVRAALDSAVHGGTVLAGVWEDALESEAIPVTRGEWGQSIDLGEGARLTVVGPPPDDGAVAAGDNDASLVLRITMGEVSFLLTGDIGKNGEAALIRAGVDVRADVLKVAHHGSRTSTSRSFLRRAGPLVDVISAGEGNAYGHPAPSVLDRLEGDLVLRTDEDGDVTVSTDGRTIWVRTGR